MQGYTFKYGLRISKKKISETFPCGVCLSCVEDDMFIEVPLFQETSPALKNSWLLVWVLNMPLLLNIPG